MPDEFEVLAACPLFEGVSRQDMAAMLQCMQARVYWHGGSVIRVADSDVF